MKSDYLWQVILSPLSPQPTYSFLFQEKTFSKDAVLKRLCFGGILLYFSHYWSEKKQNKHSVVTSIFHQLFQNPRKETRCAIIFFSKSCLKRPNNIVVKCLSLVCCSQKLNKNQQSYDTHDIWLIAANFRKALAVFSYYKKKKKVKIKIVYSWSNSMPLLISQPLISRPYNHLQGIKKWSSDESPYQLTTTLCAICSINLLENMQSLSMYLQAVMFGVKLLKSMVQV